MKWKNRITNYNFWISIVSATLLILQAFDIKLDIANINEIVTALLGLLVVIGIINDPTKSSKDAENETKNSSKKKSDNKTNQPADIENKAEKDAEINAEKDEQKVENEQKDIPIEQQNEDDYGANETDLQVLIDKIAQDLEQKYAELNKAVELLNKNQIEQTVDAKQSENEVPVEDYQPVEQNFANNVVDHKTEQFQNENKELKPINGNLIIPTNNAETEQENISFNIVN